MTFLADEAFAKKMPPTGVPVSLSGFAGTVQPR
jgi:hypothetical protein